MATNRSQHFVPKSLLQNFGIEIDLPAKERKQISMVNISRKKIVRGTSIKDQCAKDYFYGKDLIFEKNLSVIEGAFGTLVKDIISSNTLRRDYATRSAISLMVSLQENRTAVAEEEINEQIEKFMKLAAFGRIDTQNLAKLKIKLTNAAGSNVQTAMVVNPIIYDLK